MQHERLSLNFFPLLEELLTELLFVVLDFAAFLLQDVDTWVLLHDKRKFFNLHGLVEQRLLFFELLLHLLRDELILAIDRHGHTAGLHLLEVLLLHLGIVGNLLVGEVFSLLNVLGDLGLLSFHLHVL